MSLSNELLDESDSRMSRNIPSVYYLAPDFDIPSWGNATLYIHSELLKQKGIKASVLHHQRPYKYTWMESNADFSYLDDDDFEIKEYDILIVPEVNALDEIPQNINCRKILFVQNAFLIIAKLEKAYDFSEMGYESSIVTQPHMKDIMERFFGLSAQIMPHTIPSYFFLNNDRYDHHNRKRQLVLFPKHVYEHFGHLDYQILKKMLYRKLYVNYKSDDVSELEKRGDWDLIELRDKTHEEVAEVMKESAFFICVNTLEGFNVTVPEAMAAGCIPVCYDAYGGEDYLEDKKNAYAFPNNHLFPLIDKIFELIDNYDHIQEELDSVRKNGLDLAMQHTDKKIQEILFSYFEPLTNI